MPDNQEEFDDNYDVEENISYEIQLKCDYIRSQQELKHSSNGAATLNFSTPLLRSSQAGKSGKSIQLYPAQQRAILSSLFNRVTLIIGPPGTGKTVNPFYFSPLLSFKLISFC